MPADAPAIENLPPKGDLAKTSPDALLRFCEATRFTGTLAFESTGARGVLPVLNGAPEIPPDDEKLDEALVAFLASTEGHYTLEQQLPPLEGANADGPLALRGALGAFPIADLLRYCEGAGLSGTLTLRQGERTYTAKYERGELDSVTVDDAVDADLSDVFKWNTGEFEIRARPAFGAAEDNSPPSPALLKTLEVALTDIMRRSERHGIPIDAAAPRPSAKPPSMLRQKTLPFGVERSADAKPLNVPPLRPRTVAPPPANPDGTVKIFYVDKSSSAEPSRTKHATLSLGREELPLAAPPPESEKHVRVDAERAEAVLAAHEATKQHVAAVDAPSADPKVALAPAAEPAAALAETSAVSNDIAPTATAHEAPKKPSTRPGPRTSLAWTAAFAVVLASSAIAALAVLVSLLRE